jgi:predicted outer membrane repeat protein
MFALASALTALALLAILVLLLAEGGTAPVHADPDTRYVDAATGSDDSDCTDPEDPCQSVVYALTQAANGDEVLIAVGVYTGTLDVHGLPLTLRGGYTANGANWSRQGGETVIEGDGADSAVITVSPSNFVMFEGLTVHGGNNVSDVGGAFFLNGAEVTISDTVVTGNFATSGGGIYAENSVPVTKSHVTVLNSIFTGNTSDGPAGIATSAFVSLTLENTVFTGNNGDSTLDVAGERFEIAAVQVVSNTATGPWLVHLNGPGSISGTKVLSNTGTALAAWPGSNVAAHNLTIRNNQGGAILSHGVMTLTDSIVQGNHEGDWYVINAADEFNPGAPRLTLDNCVIRDNPQQKGVLVLDGRVKIMDTVIAGHDTTDLNGDVINFHGNIVEAELVNVLVVNNQSARPTLNGNNPSGKISLMNVTVGGNTVRDWPIVAGDGNWTLTNSVVWGNTPPADMMGLGSFTVSYSDIENGWTGTGNLDVDPLFLDAAGGDYRLHVSSPVKDVGTAVGAPDHDLDGVARPQGGGFDMGAYEWTGHRVLLPIVLREN